MLLHSYHVKKVMEHLSNQQYYKKETNGGSNLQNVLAQIKCFLEVMVQYQSIDKGTKAALHVCRPQEDSPFLYPVMILSRFI